MVVVAVVVVVGVVIVVVVVVGVVVVVRLAVLVVSIGELTWILGNTGMWDRVLDVFIGVIKDLLDVVAVDK